MTLVTMMTLMMMMIMMMMMMMMKRRRRKRRMMITSLLPLGLKINIIVYDAITTLIRQPRSIMIMIYPEISMPIYCKGNRTKSDALIYLPISITL